MTLPIDWLDADPDDHPRSMKCETVRNRRTMMLVQPHVMPLADYVRSLRAMNRGEVQDFDPLDGGIHADILFLFEKPGPMTDSKRQGRRTGSGFISRNNDDQTAVNTIHFMQEIGLHRRRTITWNAIPWWNGTRDIRGDERSQGAAALISLVNLLPVLRTIVFVGKEAGKMAKHVQGFRILQSSHPSNLVRNGNRHLWDKIPETWKKATE